MPVEFELTSSQKQIQEFAHQFAESVVRPISLQADREHKLPEDFLLRLQAMQGMMQAGEIPEEYGGEGEGAGAIPDKRGKRQGNRVAMIGAEAVAWGDASILLNLPGPGLGGPPVRFMGTPEQKK